MENKLLGIRKSHGKSTFRPVLWKMVMFSSIQYTMIETAIREPHNSIPDLCCPVWQPMAAYGYLNSIKVK